MFWFTQRYQRQGNDIVMSLNVYNKYETVCDTRANYNTAGQSNGKQYIRFTMKYIQGTFAVHIPEAAKCKCKVTVLSCRTI